MNAGLGAAAGGGVLMAAAAAESHVGAAGEGRVHKDPKVCVGPGNVCGVSLAGGPVGVTAARFTKGEPKPYVLPPPLAAAVVAVAGEPAFAASISRATALLATAKAACDLASTSPQPLLTGAAAAASATSSLTLGAACRQYMYRRADVNTQARGVPVISMQAQGGQHACSNTQSLVSS